MDTSTLEVPLNGAALTYDDGKAPLSVLPWAALDEMAFVQAYGHAKYKDFYNYRKGMEVSRNLSCALRHIRDYMSGIDLDAESGRSHLAHALTRIAFVLQNMKDGTAIDDRYKSPAVEPVVVDKTIRQVNESWLDYVKRCPVTVVTAAELAALA